MPSLSGSYNLFIKYENTMVCSYIISPAYHRVAEKAERYQAVAFLEEHYMQIGVSSLLKNTPQACEIVPRFHANDWIPGRYSRKQMDDAGCGNLYAFPEAFSKLVMRKDFSDES